MFGSGGGQERLSGILASNSTVQLEDGEDDRGGGDEVSKEAPGALATTGAVIEVCEGEVTVDGPP